MNWDQIQGNWKQLSGKIRAEFAKLTDSDMETVKGNRDRLLGKIQETYGIAKEEAEKRLNALTNKL